MAKIHITMQGKGGVGKSFVSTISAQFIQHRGNTPLCFDSDPINPTFYGFLGLKVVRIPIMDGDIINARYFDDLIEKIASTTHDVVIDNGASSFVPLSHYLISNEVPSLLSGLGHQLVLHTVITGGQAMLDTVSGFSQLVNQFPSETQFVVWLNPFWGPIEYEGKSFQEMKVFKENEQRISNVIEIPKLKEETFGKDLSEMLKERLTFDEAITAESRSLMTKQRLKIVKDALFSQLENSVLV